MRISILMVLALFAAGCNEPVATPTPDKPPAETAEPETTARADTTTAAPTTVAETDEPETTTTATDDGSKAGTSKTAKTEVPKPGEKTEPEPKDEPVVGDKKSEPQYAVWLQSSSKYAVNKPGTVQAVLTAKDGWKCNDAYPYKFKVASAPEGVSFSSPVATGASVSKERTSLTISFTPTSAGKKTISGKFFFSVCNESSCKIQKQDLSATINVE